MPTHTLPRAAVQHPVAQRATPGAAPGSSAADRTHPSLAWMDLLRIAAIVAVVVIHAISSATKGGGTGWHSLAWWAANLLNSACLWCVPVFVMVSGALLLDPERRTTSSTFLRRRALRIGVPLVFWIGVYLIFQRQFYGADLSVGTAVKAIASGDPYLQLYFLFIVAGLTVLTPVLRKVIRHSSRSELYWLTGATLGFGLAEHAFRELSGGGGFNATTRFLPYVGYYLAGYMLRTAEVTDRTQRLSRGLLLTGWLATALGSGAISARYGWSGNGSFLYDYLSPTVMVMSLAAFATARTWRPKRLSDRRMRHYGSATFGVFLVHPLILFPLMRSIGLLDGPTNVGRTVAFAVPLAIVVCLAATGVALVVARIPGVRRVLC